MSKKEVVVLVTGASGYLGSHCVNQLLAQGYTVRATVRSLGKVEQVKKQVLSRLDEDVVHRLQFFPVDLLHDEGWAEATQGASAIFHVASPFPIGSPKDENELIKPAVEGTLRALRFAKISGIKRVIVTSSFAAIGYGHQQYTQILDENSWTNVNGRGVSPYIKSKALAEQAAWQEAKADTSLELTTINPVAIFGPLLPGTKDVGASMSIIKQIISGQLPAAPLIKMGVVDVRDVAVMHIQALERREAVGRRFLAVANDGKFVSMQEIGMVLGVRIRTLPDWIIRSLAPFSSLLKAAASELGLVRKTTNQEAVRVLGTDFKNWEQTIKDSAASLKVEGFAK